MRRNRVLIGDAVTRLGELPAHSVDTVVTSPP
jgi:DNA modification methylase